MTPLSSRFWRAAMVLLSVTFVAAPSAFASHRDISGKSLFARAERLREALNGRPTGQRSRQDYRRVMDAYRRVYYAAPTSSNADAGVVGIAELLAEMGRQFEDQKSSHAAIGQYEFLRREYPGSRYRFDALFTIGQIYKEDLGDPAGARAAFQEFLKRYPRHRLAEQARKAVSEITAAAHETQSSKPDPPDKDTTDTDVAETPVAHQDLPRITGIRQWSTPDYTRVAVDLEKDLSFTTERLHRPNRIVFNLKNSQLAAVLVGKSFDVGDGLLKKIRVAEYQPGVSRIVLEVDDVAKYSAFLIPNPDRLIIDIHGQPSSVEHQKSARKPQTSGTLVASNTNSDGPHDAENDDVTVTVTTPLLQPVARKSSDPIAKAPAALSRPAKIISDEDEGPATATDRSYSSGSRGTKRSTSQIDAREARPTANGGRSLIRALGLKIGRIVIDPGHGGHDTGTIGPQGLREKDLVLDVAQRLGKLLETRLGADVVYTREDDTFVPLETRTAVANREQADLFVSVHANSSRDPDARGVETYYLNFTSSADALEVAARENAVSEKSVHELQDLVKKIALKEKIEESREFAFDVQHALYSGLVSKSPNLRNRGVKKAPFVVLIGANMPSILAEISFVSNPSDEHKLQTGNYRQKIAESLYRGIAQYAGGLSGIKVASTREKPNPAVTPAVTKDTP
jgi:N-acetylmuramoyl-L-alanine amidase